MGSADNAPHSAHRTHSSIQYKHRDSEQDIASADIVTWHRESKGNEWNLCEAGWQPENQYLLNFIVWSICKYVFIMPRAVPFQEFSWLSYTFVVTSIIKHTRMTRKPDTEQGSTQKAPLVCCLWRLWGEKLIIINIMNHRLFSCDKFLIMKEKFPPFSSGKWINRHTHSTNPRKIEWFIIQQSLLMFYSSAQPKWGDLCILRDIPRNVVAIPKSQSKTSSLNVVRINVGGNEFENRLCMQKYEKHAEVDGIMKYSSWVVLKI